MRRLRWLLALLGALLAVALLAGGTAVYFAVTRQPAPWSDSCTASASGDAVRLEPAQARNAAIIAGVGLRRGLGEPAVTIALATAWQESGLRNLPHGDRDSIGLFQQRPSQGWGTEAQIMDPYYAAGAFYVAMVKVDGWRTADVGDVAQAVQRSGYPDAYDKWVAKARVLAAGFTGASGATFTCAERTRSAADAAGLASYLGKTLPAADRVTRSGQATLTIDTPDAAAARSAAALTLAHGSAYGVLALSADGKAWRASWPLSPEWRAADQAGPAGRVVVTLG